MDTEFASSVETAKNGCVADYQFRSSVLHWFATNPFETAQFYYL